VKGHGGNPNFLRFFVQAQLERQRDYVVYFYDPAGSCAHREDGPDAAVGSGG
jgi:creatinine amidohydrolase